MSLLPVSNFRVRGFLLVWDELVRDRTALKYNPEKKEKPDMACPCGAYPARVGCGNAVAHYVHVGCFVEAYYGRKIKVTYASRG